MSTHEGFKSDALTGPHPGTYSTQDQRPPDRLAGTTAEDHVLAPLQVGEFATIMNGAQPIRFRLAAAIGLADQVATTDPIIPAYGVFPYLVEKATCVPYVQSEDGATAFECWVYRSSR